MPFIKTYSTLTLTIPTSPDDTTHKSSMLSSHVGFMTFTGSSVAATARFYLFFFLTEHLHLQNLRTTIGKKHAWTTSIIIIKI